LLGEEADVAEFLRHSCAGTVPAGGRPTSRNFRAACCGRRRHFATSAVQHMGDMDSTDDVGNMFNMDNMVLVYY
jgi:hypothetical protein